MQLPGGLIWTLLWALGEYAVCGGQERVREERWAARSFNLLGVIGRKCCGGTTLMCCPTLPPPRRCRFGPCTGITRLQRWERAAKLNLKPPPEVPAILERHSDDPDMNRDVFFHPY